MAARAIVFDIGGVLSIASGGSEPTAAFPGMVARWERRLALEEGALLAHLASGRDGGVVGAFPYEAWAAGVRAFAGMSDGDFAGFERDFWDLYLGELNVELADRLRGWRGRHRTALLSKAAVPHARNASRASRSFPFARACWPRTESARQVWTSARAGALTRARPEATRHPRAARIRTGRAYRRPVRERGWPRCASGVRVGRGEREARIVEGRSSWSDSTP